MCYHKNTRIDLRTWPSVKGQKWWLKIKLTLHSQSYNSALSHIVQLLHIMITTAAVNITVEDWNEVSWHAELAVVDKVS